MHDIDFVIVTKNQIEYTARCIESIFAHVGRPFHLILVDNASTDGTRQYYEKLAERNGPHFKITVILNETNQGYVMGANQGLERSRAPYVILSNNDVVIYPNAVEEMIRIADQKSEFGLVNPNSNEFGFGAYNERKLGPLRGAYRERCHAAGFFVLIKRGAIDSIGVFDPAYSPGYFEEMDYSERAKRAGFLCVVARAAYVHHYGSRSFGAAGKKELMDAHRAIFTARWGGTKWFCYLGDRESVLDSKRRGEVVAGLLRVARENIAVIYLFVPRRAKKYFEEIHDSFRIIETPGSLSRFALLAKVWRSFRSKPISRIYVSDERTMDFFKKLAFFHGAEVLVLSLVSDTSASDTACVYL